MGGLQFLSLLLSELVGVHCLVDNLLSLVLDQEFSKISVVIPLHLPEENVALCMLRLFEQVIIE